MSTQKVKKLKRELNYTATWLADVLTVTTDAPHYLKSDDVVSFQFANSPQELANVAVTVTAADEFTIPLTDPGSVQSTGKVIVGYFSAGMTGDQPIFSIAKTMDLPSVVQFTAHGAAGAVLVLSLSNDGEGWVEVATITLDSVDLASDYVTIAPQWAKAKLNITSIGADTSVVVTVAS